MMNGDHFRREAVEAHATGYARGRAEIPLGRRWIRLSYWAILALLVAGLLASMLVHVEERTAGPAVVEPRGLGFTALLPAGAAADIGSAPSLAVEFPSSGIGTRLAVARARVKVATPAAIEHAGLHAGNAQWVLVSGRLAPARGGPPLRQGKVPARLVVVLGSDSLAQVVARQVRTVVGASG
jgi:hypothetical protein